MNNILDFLQYKEQVRLYEESLVESQILEPIEESLRGKIRKKINSKAEVFVKAALADEIEMGRQLNEQIQQAVEELKEYIEKIQQTVDDSNPEKSEFFKKIEKIFEDIRKSSFGLLEILSGVNINFADYVQNATMATLVNFGVMFIPTRSIFLLKKSYKYFIGLIKNTIRKDLLMLMLNFDQFENTVLIQSLEDDEMNKEMEKLETQKAAVDQLIAVMMGEKSKKGQSYEKVIKDAERASKLVKQKFDMELKSLDRKTPAIGFDTRYDNTYTKTLDQLKGFVLEDDSKYLEAIKAGMRTQALDEVDTKSYVELLISAAEECAFEVSNAIHTNFIEKVSVFKLANQKRLIELVKKDKELFEKQKAEDERKIKEELDNDKNEKLKRVIDAEGPKIFKKVVEDNPGNEDKQIEEFENLDEIEVDGEKYSEKEILNGWLSLYDKDSRKFNNWDDKKDSITDGLKLYLSDVVPNEDSYIKYADFLVECLFPCACKNVDVIVKEKTCTVTVRTVTGSSATKKLTRSRTVKTYKTEFKPVKMSVENAFSVLALREADAREERLLDIIYEKDSRGDYKKSDENFVVDDKKKKLLQTSLKLISKNFVKLESDVIEEVIEKMYNKENLTYQMSNKIMDDVIKQFKKLEKFKDNEYDTSIGTNDKEEGNKSE